MLKELRKYFAQTITFILTLVPVLGSCPTCPTCFPIYSSILSLFGLRLADYTHYLLPVMLISMFVSLRQMYLDVANLKVSYYPFIGATVSCLSLLFFKYALAYTLLPYVAVAGLYASTILHHRNLNICCNDKTCAHKIPEPVQQCITTTKDAKTYGSIFQNKWQPVINHGNA